MEHLLFPFLFVFIEITFRGIQSLFASLQVFLLLWPINMGVKEALFWWKGSRRKGAVHVLKGRDSPQRPLEFGRVALLYNC